MDALWNSNGKFAKKRNWIIIDMCFIDLKSNKRMKVVFPKNIKKGLLAGMSFDIGPVNLTIFQLFIIAVGAGIALVVFNSLSQWEWWSNAIWIAAAVPIFAIFLVVAFFKISELWLLPFMAKLLRNNFFDVKKKFQNNFVKHNQIEILIKETKLNEDKKDLITHKSNKKVDKGLLSDIENSGLI